MRHCGRVAEVSVIITVYNEEEYLRECLDSLRRQTLADFEAICVNDASTDSSRRILEEYASADSRFVIRDNPRNVGLTKSRAEAVKSARGRYVALLDGDDFLAADALSEAVKAAESTGADIALMDLRMFYAEDDIRPYIAAESLPPPILDGPQAFRLCVEGKLHSVYLTRRETYARMPIDDSCRLYTDDSTARLHLLAARTVCLSKGAYYYRQHDESETHKIGAHRFDFLRANLTLAAKARELTAQKETLRALETHCWKNVIAHYWLFEENMAAFSDAEREEIRELLRKCLRSMDFSLLPLSVKLRPPYWPARSLRELSVKLKVYAFLRRLKKSLSCLKTSLA